MVRPLRSVAFIALALVASCGSPTRPQDLIPTLVTPAADAVLANGCVDFSCSRVWNFGWSKVPGATKYHLYVVGPSALTPVVDLELVGISYQYESQGYVTNLFQQGWHWRVQAQVNGTYGDWSETRTFSVQPLSSSMH